MKQASHLKETTSFDVKKINDPNSSSINTVYSVRQIRVRPVLQLQGNPVDAILKGGTKKKKFFYVFRKLHRPNHISEEDAKFKPSNLFIVGQKKKKAISFPALAFRQAFTRRLLTHSSSLCDPQFASVAILLQHLTEGPAVRLDYFYFSTLCDKNTWLMVGREGQRKHKLLLKTLTIT